MNVALYTTPTCPYCHQARAFLSARGVRFTEHDVSADRAAADEMIKRSGQMGVPVITVGDQVVVGFDRAHLERLLAQRHETARPAFGLRIADAGRIAQKKGLPPVPGAYVGGVAPSSPAHRAGLAPGDVITEVDQGPIRGADDLERSLSQLTPGRRVSITYIRDGQRLHAEAAV